MAISDSFTIVVPTRDDPIRCQHMLESMVQNTHPELSIRVVFLVNDTGSDATNRLEKTISAGQFASLQPRLLRATQNPLPSRKIFGTRSAGVWMLSMSISLSLVTPTRWIWMLYAVQLGTCAIINSIYYSSG